MARAHTVWVVIDDRRDVKAAFTVKHELVSWLQGKGPTDDYDWRPRNVNEWRVIRFRDGNPHHTQEYYSIDDFLGPPELED
jgi:hypothetical protein